LNDNFKEVAAIRSLVEEHIPDTTMNRHFGRELSYVLPREHVASFPALFTRLEKLVEHGQAQQIGFNSYGVSMTTLEEVNFIHSPSQSPFIMKLEPLKRHMINDRPSNSLYSPQSIVELIQKKNIEFEIWISSLVS